MRRTWKWLLRIIGVAGVVVAIVLGVYVSSARSIAERQILATLKEMGFDDASVQVQSIGTSRLQVSNLILGKEAGLRIGAIGVDYGLRGPTSVHVETVEVIGAMLDLRWQNGRLDVGPLAQLKSGGEPRLSSDGVPFDTLLLRSSFVMFQWNNLRYAIPAEATLTHRGQGVCDVDARLWVLGVEVPFKGTIDFTASAGANPSAQTPADRIAFDLTTPLFERPLDLTGFIGTGATGTQVVASMRKEPGERSTFELLAKLDRGAEDTIISLEATGAPPRLAVAMAGASLEVMAGTLDGKATISVATGQISGRVEARAESVTLDMGGTRTVMARPRFDLPLKGSFGGDQFVLAAEPHIAMGFASITDNHPQNPLNIGTFGMRSSEAMFTLARAPTADDPHRLAPTLKLWLHSTPLDAKRGATELALGRVAFGANVGVDVRDQLTLDAGVTLDGGDVSLPGAEVKLSGIHLALPVTHNSTASIKPALHIDSTRFREDVFPALKGALAITDGVFAGSAEWPLFTPPAAPAAAGGKRPAITAPPATINARIDLYNGVAGEVAAQVRDLRIIDDQTFARLLKDTEAFRVTGLFNLDAKFKVQGFSFQPLITIDARDATLSSGAIDFVATGVNTSVSFSSLSPLTTMPNQRLQMKEGHLGKLNFANAVLNFRMDAIDAFVVELAGWTVGSRGRFWTHAVRFNPLKPVIETQVFIEDMSVKEWLEILQEGKAEGQGFMYGRIPFRWDSSREIQLTFGEGFLYVKPGKGWIRMQESKEVRQYLFSTLQETLANLQQEAQRRLMEAMNDFEYDTLTFDFIREGGEVMCRVTTKGRGRSGAKQEIGELQVDIHNFGVLLSQRLLRNVNSVEAVDDAIRRVFGQ